MRPAHVVDVDGRSGREPREARVEDRHALGSAVRADDHDDAPLGRPFDLPHEAAGEVALARRAAHRLEPVNVNEGPVHARGKAQRVPTPRALGAIVVTER